MARVSVKAAQGWKQYKAFHLGISMGSKNHRGEALTAIVDFANAAGFEHGLIDVSDTLNRFTHMREGKSEARAEALAAAEGRNWRLECEPILSRFTMPVQIKHWDHWRADRRFATYSQAFENAYAEQSVFRVAVNSDIAHFYSRKDDRAFHELSADEVALSRRYYTEELAGLSIQFDDFPCAEIYPGRELKCAESVRTGTVQKVPQGLKNAFFTQIFMHDFQTQTETQSRSGAGGWESRLTNG